MIVSRGLMLTRMSSHLKNLLLVNNGSNLNRQIIRNSHGGEWCYRKMAPPYPEDNELLANIGMSLFWWWITWHILADYKELILEDLPDPSKWTDEELGIPPDDE